VFCTGHFLRSAWLAVPSCHRSLKNRFGYAPVNARNRTRKSLLVALIQLQHGMAKKFARTSMSKHCRNRLLIVMRWAFRLLFWILSHSGHEMFLLSTSRVKAPGRRFAYAAIGLCGCPLLLFVDVLVQSRATFATGVIAAAFAPRQRFPYPELVNSTFTFAKVAVQIVPLRSVLMSPG
jgi:hypothetical protein